MLNASFLYPPLLDILVYVISKDANNTYSNYGIFGSIIRVHPPLIFWTYLSTKLRFA